MPFRIEALQIWVISLATIVFSISGVILALISIYALPDGTIRPELGSIFFICSTLVIVFLFSLIWKKARIYKRLFIENSIKSESGVTQIHESISDKILKWVVTVFALFFAFDSIAIALICVYALPDKTVQPVTGIIYFLGGAFVVGCFVYAVWKRR
jgi:hypothetical protein